MTRFNEQKHFPQRNVNQFGVLLYLESNDLIVTFGHGHVETERVQQVRRHHWHRVVDDEDNWSKQELETMLTGSGVLEYPQSCSAAGAVLASSRLKLSSATKPDLLWLITRPALKPQMKCKWWCRLMRSLSSPHQPRSSSANIEF